MICHRSYPEIMTGVNDKAKEGKFTFLADGKPATYLPWVGGDPNGRPGDGDCARLKYYANKNTWLYADAGCATKYHFVCQMPLDRGDSHAGFFVLLELVLVYNSGVCPDCSLKHRT